MNFCSDNTTGAAPEILAAIIAHNDGQALPYGRDDFTKGVEAGIAALFEIQADVFLVATGTAANALCLSVMTPPFGSVFCHAEAHIECDECGAPEFFTGGAKLVLLDSDDGKIPAADLEALLAVPDHGVHHVQPRVVSLTQSTECGTVYSLDEIRAITDLAHAHGLKVHMDGARFANAVAGLGCSPADVTWRAGIDALSFGASKNGALGAEAVVLFDRTLGDTFAFRRKRGGHLFSKMRFLAAQFEAYLADDLWLSNAIHANAMATRLADGLATIAGTTLNTPVQANEIFVTLPESAIQGLKSDGFSFYRWPGEGATMLRLVTAFNTRAKDVDAFIASARHHANSPPVENP
jgi:threonine aldolase